MIYGRTSGRAAVTTGKSPGNSINTGKTWPPPKKSTQTQLNTEDDVASHIKAMDAKLDSVLNAISQTRTSLEDKIGTVSADLSLLHADHRKLAEKVHMAEQKIAILEPAVVENTESLQPLLDRVRFLEGRAEDAEGRSRRNNIRLVGLPEGLEGQDMATYLEEWILSLLPKDALTPHFSIERAHRVPARKPPPGSYPRPVILRMLHFKDRDAILREMRKLKEILVENTKIMLFPDYTLAVQHQRNSFIVVKRKLRELGFQYSLLFPAKLRVVAHSKTHFFDDPKLAGDWLETLGHNVVTTQNKSTASSRPKNQKRNTQRQRPSRSPGSPNQKPQLEQIIADRRKAIQLATYMAKNNSSDEGESVGGASRDVGSSTGTSPSQPGEYEFPNVTPQTADNII